MIDVRYSATREPAWIALVAGPRVLVVDASVTDELIGDLRASLEGPAGSQAILDALTRGGISQTPTFALIEAEAAFGTGPSTITVIVRGSIEVAIESTTESSSVSGNGVSTWIERVIPDALTLFVGQKGHASAASAGREYWLREGSAPFAWLRVGDSSAAPALETPVPSAAPAASVAPAVSPAPPPTNEPVTVTQSAAGTIIAPPAAESEVDPGVTRKDAVIDDSAPEATAAPQANSDGESGYDFLFGETVVRTVEGAAVRDDAAAVADPPKAGDHDGRTAIGLTAAERRAARQARQQSKVVQSVTPAYVLEFSTGEREALSGPIIVGRAPSANKVSMSSVPRLVTVGGPDQDISRNHVEVGVEGGTVIVTDLHSRNGTVVTLPGRAPQQLRGGQATAVIAGAIIDLGSGVTIVVSEA